MLGLILLATVAAQNATITVVAPYRTALGERVPDAVLATMRGGLQLPNGLNLMLGIDIQTRVDGLLALHTAYATDGAYPGIRVFTDGNGQAQASPPPPMASVSTGTVTGTPVLVVDRSPTGTTVIPTTSTPGANVNLVTGDPSIWQSGENQTQLPVVENGPAVPTAQGAVSLVTGASGAAVILKASDLEVQQLIGQATGVVVANTANNRTIDTVSAIQVDLQGLPASTLAGLFAAQRAALEGLITR